MSTPESVNLESTLAFFRRVNTSVAIDMRAQFDQWVSDQRFFGEDIDEDLVAAVEHDLDVHHRLTPETISGAPHARYASLDHTEDQHFGRE